MVAFDRGFFQQVKRSIDLQDMLLLEMVPGARVKLIDGFEDDTGAVSTFEDIWPGPGSWELLDAVTPIEAVSDSPEDGAGTNTGALSLVIEYLDGNLLEKSVTLTLTGTTPVVGPADVLHVQRAYIVGWDVGSTPRHFNVGNITIQVSPGGAALEYVAADENVSKSAKYTIPANKVGYIINYGESGSQSIAGGIEMHIMADLIRGSTTKYGFLPIESWIHGRDGKAEPRSIPQLIPAGSTIMMMANPNGSNERLSCSIHLLLVDLAT